METRDKGIVVYITSDKKVIPTDNEGNVLNRVNLSFENQRASYTLETQELHVSTSSRLDGKDIDILHINFVVNMPRQAYVDIRTTRRKALDRYWEGYRNALELMTPYIRQGNKIPKRILRERDDMLASLPRLMSLHELVLRYKARNIS